MADLIAFPAAEAEVIDDCPFEGEIDAIHSHLHEIYAVILQMRADIHSMSAAFTSPC